MLLCDSHFRIIGISKDTLQLLGYKDENEILGNNPYNLFMYKKGNFINFKSFINGATIPECITKKDKKEISIVINEFFFNNSEDMAYEIDILVNDLTAQNISETNSDLEKSGDLEKENEILEEKIPLEEENDEKEDYGWLMQTIKDLQMDPMDFYNFLQSFIQDANEKIEILQEAIIFKDYKVINETVHELRDSAILLNIEPVLNTLEDIKESYSDEIFENFKKFKKVLDQISKFKIEGNENEVKHN